MKKFLILTLALSLLCAVMLTGCGNGEDGHEGIKIKYIVDGYLHAQYSDGTVPSEPKKNTFVFAGWYFDEELTVPFSFDKVSEYAGDASEIRVYAKWEIAEHAHRMIHKAGKAASCTEDGILEHYICADCGVIFLDEQGNTPTETTVIKAGHKLTLVPEKVPTCTVDGNIAYYLCSGCNTRYSDSEAKNTVSEVTLAAHHSFASEWSIGALEHWYAATCGHDVKDALSKHNFVGGFCEVCNINEYPYLVFTPLGTDAYSVGTGPLAVGMNEITIPDTFAGLHVTEISADGFKDLSELRKITLPSGLTKLGERAFSGCSSLTSLTLGPTVTEIGDDAFLDCHSLVEVYDLTESVTVNESHPSKVGKYALDIYTESTAESKLTEKDGYIFYENESTVYLIKYVGNSKTLTLPDSFNVKSYSIYSYAFYKNKNITSVNLPNSILGIGEYAFSECTSLSDAVIGSGVSTIGGCAFFDCSALTVIKCRVSEKPVGYSESFNLRADGEYIDVLYGYKSGSTLPIQPL